MWVRAVVLWLAGSLVAAPTAPSRRIIDGRDAASGEYPFVVNKGFVVKLIFTNKTEILQPPKPGSCSGTAISPEWVLTARHCSPASPLPSEVARILYRKKTNESLFKTEIIKVILYGLSQRKNNGERRYSRILKYAFLPDTRDQGIIDDDIALCHTEAMLIERYARVSAVPYMALYGRAAAVAGCGLMKETDNKLNFSLSLNRPFQVIDRVMIRSCDRLEQECVFPSMILVPACGEMPTPIFGDSGGPVMHATGVIGVIMNGAGFILWNQPHMSRSKNILTATPISPYINWIVKVITDKQ